MKYSKKILYPLLILFFAAGCSLFRTQPAGTLFTFTYEGKTYEIAGYSNESGESLNYLTFRDNGDVVFRAVDRNQSGLIDQVIHGSISVLEANEIYRAGIQLALENDQFKRIDRNRIFEQEYGDYQLMVESYLKKEDQFHNRFVLFNLNWDLVGIYWDEDSDGTIDRKDAGDLDMELVQELYSIAISSADKQKRLEKTDNDQLIINANTKRQRELAGSYD
ncbi:hypothetical protein [Rhodohalobacter sp. 8-1]|uniref:hypothetical protein n=1 Tax=Rhodohalobacter sp. 8-1 TaxID=3131972 RepID=UPI0030EE322E